MMTSPVLQKYMQNMAEEKVIAQQRRTNLSKLKTNQCFLQLYIRIQWLTSFNGTLTVPFVFLLFSLLQCGANFNLPVNTVYLAKIYLDIFFSKSNNMDSNHFSKLCICSLWMAAKFNELNHISQSFDVEIICTQSLLPFSFEELLETEALILELLQFELKYSTPFDYCQPFFDCFPVFLSAKGAVKSLIELSSGISQLSKDSSLNIFYGSLRAISTLKNINFQTFASKLTDPIVLDLQRIETVSEAIIERYNQILCQEMEGEDNAQQTQHD